MSVDIFKRRPDDLGPGRNNRIIIIADFSKRRPTFFALRANERFVSFQSNL